MRSALQINAEIARLKKALTARRWNAKALEQIEGQIEVLEKRMDADEVELLWYVDETAEEYSDGDNELWSELDQTARWMAGEKGYHAPSKGL